METIKDSGINLRHLRDTDLVLHEEDTSLTQQVSRLKKSKTIGSPNLGRKKQNNHLYENESSIVTIREQDRKAHLRI